MGTERRFCRFSRAAATAPFSLTEVPPDGLCLSAFALLTAREDPRKVLLGRIDPAAPWDHLGALDPDRVLAWQDRWMLPASHLILLESPQQAGQRILRELAGLAPRTLEGPQVVSEVYAPERHPAARQHWDLEFLFRGEASEGEVRPGKVWRELRFLDPAGLATSEFARGHDEVLASAGLRRSPPGTPGRGRGGP